MTDLERWKAAAARTGARNFSEWVRWVLDKEAAMQAAAERNPWVDRRTGRARQLEMGANAGASELSSGARRKILRGLDAQIETGRMVRARLAAESEGL